jgi:hypothetical protein
MTGLTGLALYALIWLVILSAPSATTVSVSATVAAATGYFLIGATVGFLSHLRREAEQGARAAMDDYGLTFARMLVTPLLSGMAAVFGVVLIAIFAVTQTGEAGVDMPKLIGFLEIGRHPPNLVVAATFG